MIIDMPTVSMGTNGSIITADRVAYDNATSGLEADNVQDAVDEVNSNLEESNVWSGEEKLVGKTLDGKNIYEKTFKSSVYTVAQPPSGTENTRWTYKFIFDSNADYYDELIDGVGYHTLTMSGVTYKRPYNYIQLGAKCEVVFCATSVIDGNGLTYFIATPYNNSQITAITAVMKFRYTKK